MSYSRAEISEFEKKIGKSQATLFRWAKQGCDLRDANSVQAWVERNRLRETNIAKSRRRRGFTQKASSNVPRQAPAAFKPQSKRQILGPPGKLGAGLRWRDSRKKRSKDSGDSRLHWRMAMRLRSMQLKPTGCESLRRCDAWIASLKFRDAAKNR
jgi:hypothetical protein